MSEEEKIQGVGQSERYGGGVQAAKNSRQGNNSGPLETGGEDTSRTGFRANVCASGINVANTLFSSSQSPHRCGL